jgi:hypothetical protein
MVDLRAIGATLAVAALVGCGGSGGADSQDAGQHDAVGQHDAAAVGLSGTLSLNHAALPDGVKGWVFVYDQAPGVGTPPVAYMQVAASGAWSFPDVAAGSYYLLGAVDVNRSGAFEAPGSTLADLFTILGPQVAPASGVALDVLTVIAFVGSVRVAGPVGDENDLYILRATVLDPRNANAMTDATVVASDGALQFPLAFSTVTYEPAAPLDVTAVDGTYTFTFSHPLAYQTPLVVAIPHHPLQARPTLVAPTPDQHFAAVQDLEVSWQPAAGTTDTAVDVFDLAGMGTRVYTAEAITSPHLIPAATAGFTAGHTYRVSITDLRYAGTNGVVSVEAGSTDVTISF